MNPGRKYSKTFKPQFFNFSNFRNHILTILPGIYSFDISPTKRWSVWSRGENISNNFKTQCFNLFQLQNSCYVKITCLGPIVANIFVLLGTTQLKLMGQNTSRVKPASYFFNRYCKKFYSSWYIVAWDIGNCKNYCFIFLPEMRNLICVNQYFHWSI